MTHRYTDIALGRGEWIVGHAIVEGTPAIIFTPAPKPGKFGEDASDQIDRYSIQDDAIVLRFTTGESACAHLDRLKLAVESYEKAHQAFQGKTE